MQRQTYESKSLLHERKYLRLPEEDKELLCELSFNDEILKEMQRVIAADLVRIYNDKPKTWFNLQKIENFTAIANKGKKEVKKAELSYAFLLDQFRKIIHNNWIRFRKNLNSIGTWYQKFDFLQWYQSIKTITLASSLLTLAGWFASFRLFLLRLNRFSVFSGLIDPDSSIFLTMFAYAIKMTGVSYALSLCIDICIILGETLLSPKWDKSIIKYLLCMRDHFIAVMTEDGRIPRMANDAVWLAINLTGIVLTGGLSLLIVPAINIVGFAFDWCNEALQTLFAYRKYAFLKEDIENVIQKQKTGLELHEKDEYFGEDILELYAEKKALEDLEAALSEKIIDVFITRTRVLVSTALLVVSMFLVFFPPAAGAAIAGAAGAFAFGSIFIGFGSRIYYLVKDCVDYLRVPIEEETEIVDLSTNKIGRGLGISSDKDKKIKSDEIKQVPNDFESKNSPLGQHSFLSQNNEDPDTRLNVVPSNSLRND